MPDKSDPLYADLTKVWNWDDISDADEIYQLLLEKIKLSCGRYKYYSQKGHLRCILGQYGTNEYLDMLLQETLNSVEITNDTLL